MREKERVWSWVDEEDLTELEKGKVWSEHIVWKKKSIFNKNLNYGGKPNNNQTTTTTKTKKWSWGYGSGIVSANHVHLQYGKIKVFKACSPLSKNHTTSSVQIQDESDGKPRNKLKI